MVSHFVNNMTQTVLRIVFVLTFVSQISSGTGVRNNACKKIRQYSYASISRDCYENPNIQSTVPALVTRAGYPNKGTTVQTEDGYILSLHRIQVEGGQPVILQHGLATNPQMWVDKNNDSLAFYLSDAGYDVWISEYRGYANSKNHVNMTVYDRRFWRFSLDDLAKDVSAVVRHVAHATGQAGNIVFLGHSMGGTGSIMYALDRPREATAFLRGMVQLAPAVYMDGSPIWDTFTPLRGPIRVLTNLLGLDVLFMTDSTWNMITDIVCRAVPYACWKGLDFLFGFDSGQLKPDYLLLILSSTPVHTLPINLCLHYMQIDASNKFQKYDFGVAENKKVYGSKQPPQYDLSKLTLPMVYFYGKNDRLVPYKGVERSFKQLGSSKKKLLKLSLDGKYPFTHLNFNYAKDGRKLLFKLILQEIKETIGFS